MTVVAVITVARDAEGAVTKLSRLAQSERKTLRYIVDSGSRDGTREAARMMGWSVLRGPVPFDHGGTRRWAACEIGAGLGSRGILVFVTQDVVSLDDSGALDVLVESIERDDRVGAAYGRQLPRPGARPFEAHARLFNYPDRSEIRTLEDAKRLGIKACFFSDSFAAYRVKALEEVGGFPERAIVGEDVIVAAKLLKAGWKIAYVADACVYHSHDLTPTQEMRRYFDIGVFHAREEWILREFGKPEGEGLRFLLSELRYLWQHAPWLIPESFLRAGLKYLGYRLGRAERHLPLWFKRRLSLQKHFWEREAELQKKGSGV